MRCASAAADAQAVGPPLDRRQFEYVDVIKGATYTFATRTSTSPYSPSKPMQRVWHRYRSHLMLLGCGLLVLLCPILVVLRDVQTHNRQLELIAESVYNAPLPANTTV